MNAKISINFGRHLLIDMSSRRSVSESRTSERSPVTSKPPHPHTPDYRTPPRESRCSKHPSTPNIPLPQYSQSPPSRIDLRYNSERDADADNLSSRSRSPVDSHDSHSKVSEYLSSLRVQKDSILSQSPLNGDDTGIESTAALVSPRKPAPVHRDIPAVPKPWGAGQEFAASEILSLGIAQEDRAAMRKFYQAHEMFLLPPQLDSGLPQKLFLEAWPKDSKSKSNYPPFVTEKRLVKQQQKIAEWARPSIQAIEDIQLTKLPTDTKKMLIKYNTDTLQYLGDEHRALTEERRVNLFSASPLAKHWVHLLKEREMYGEWPETRDSLFGKVFCQRITKYLMETAELRRGLDSSRWVSNNTCTISPFIIKILFSMKLPKSPIPINFYNLADINFIGGRLQLFLSNWYKVTSNNDILNVIKGHKINFYAVPSPKDLSRPESKSVSERQVVQSLLKTRVIEKTDSEGVVSPIFLKKKPNGLHRMILDLTDLNLGVEKQHFKMQSLQDALLIIRKGDYLTKIDLTSAYDCVPVDPTSRKYLQFRSGGVLYQFRGFPNGLSEAPRLFTLITHPINEILNHLGIRHVLYLDDMLIMAESTQASKVATSYAVQLFTNLGFVINQSKSISDPSLQIEFLGFSINSENLTIKLTDKKVEKIIASCKHLQSFKAPTKRQIASTIGLLVSVTPAIPLGPLHYRGLQRLQISVSTGWETKTMMTAEALRDLGWWISSVSLVNGTSFAQNPPILKLKTDASTQGWGAVLGNQTAQDFWTDPERQNHINILELTAIKNGLLALLTDCYHTTLLIQSDSAVALSYVRKKGGTKCMKMNAITSQIWEFAQTHSLNLLTQHIPGKENTQADYLSRLPPDRSDWHLNRKIWREVNTLRGPLTLDLFARLWNSQTKKFVAWRAHPAAWSTDAFSISWPNLGAYAFPPFGLISQTLLKVQTEQCTIVLIAPVWKNSAWYSNILQMSCNYPLILPTQKDLLTDNSQNCHPLLEAGKLTLAAWTVSGDSYRLREFQQKLLQSSLNSRDLQPKNLITVPGGNGLSGIVNGIPIPFLPLSQ